MGGRASAPRAKYEPVSLGTARAKYEPVSLGTARASTER